MRFNSRLVLSLLAVVPSALAAVNGACSNNVKGICISTGTCGNYHGTTSTGNCPSDPNDVKCCSNIPCSADGMTGSCMFTNECDGTTYSGLCPGGSNFKCCIRKNPITTTGVGSPCNGVSGTCIDVNTTGCPNQVLTGKCPGPANVKCCPSGSGLLAQVQNAADIARQRAHPSSTGWCAKYVREALNLAGITFAHPGLACEYHSLNTLKNIGFTEIARPASFQKGDIIVFECNAAHDAGHLEIYDGSRWYSDFAQNSEDVYSSNIPPKHYYRVL